MLVIDDLGIEAFPSLIGSSKTSAGTGGVDMAKHVSIPHRKFKNAFRAVVSEKLRGVSIPHRKFKNRRPDHMDAVG